LATATVVVLVGTVAGCGGEQAATPKDRKGSPPATSPGASAPPDASPQLAAALQAVAAQSMRLTVVARGGQLECDHQASNHSFSCSGDTADGALDEVAIGPELYLRIPRTGSRFLRYTVARLPDRMDLLILLDPLFGSQFLANARNVHERGPGLLEATVDLTKVAVTGTDKRIADALSAHAGTRATAVPVRVSVDAQGRLAGIQAVFPAGDKADELEYTVKITDIDPTVGVFPPQNGRWVEAPASAYK
jgi:hypothetical protein